MILVVRSASQLPSTLEALTSSGFTNLVSLPISTSEIFPNQPPTNTILIFTSPHGVSATQPTPTSQCVCVGPATAQAARKKGFDVVLTGHTNANDLAHLINQTFPPNTHFTHMHGNTAHLNWHQHVREHHNHIHKQCVYHTHYLPALPTDIIAKLPHITHILMFSAGGASHLLNLLKTGNMLSCLHPSAKTVVLSPQVAQDIKNLPNVIISPKPNLTSLLETLRQNL